eukprot:7759513-Pyramimonas_sp.AAC.1
MAISLPPPAATTCAHPIWVIKGHDMRMVDDTRANGHNHRCTCRLGAGGARTLGTKPILQHIIARCFTDTATAIKTTKT